MIRVAPNEPHPTHHIRLNDRRGRTLGMTICDDAGGARPFRDERIFIKIPVETTAQKQTSGSSSYADFEYPYSPIVQDDLSGGRGSVDYERDSTKYFDSYRCRSGRENKAYAGPLEQWTRGLRNQEQNMPGSIRWVTLAGNTRYIYKHFQASASYTVGLAWLLVRRLNTPDDMTIAIYADSAGALGTQLTSITVDSSRLADVLSEWLNETISQALTSGSYYWLVIYGGENDSSDKHWKVAVKDGVGATYATAAFDTTPNAAAFDLYFRLTGVNTNKSCIPFEYKEQQYFVVSPTSGAPTVYMAGDRGAADANTGQLTKLIDATKSWVTNEWVGSVVLITDGTGKLEPIPYRTVLSNTPTDLTLDSAWTITHDTTTEYVIVGTQLRSMGACGLSAPVTDVLVSPTGVIYCAMGDAVAIRALRAFNDSGTWKDVDNATCQRNEADAKSKAVYLVYKSQAQKIVIGNNSDANGDVSVNTSTNASSPVWGADLTWAATPTKVDSKYRRINGMIVHPDGSGNEAVWVMKSDVPFVVPASGNPYTVAPDEMRVLRSETNGVRPAKLGVYLYSPLGQGLARYYGGQWDDVGPNIGEGLPANRRGNIRMMVAYPGRLLAIIDAGATGYSSVSNSDGWHEHFRAPKGQRITAMAFQTTPGVALDRLWLYVGNDLIWLPFASNANDLDDAAYQYAPEFAVTLARMHAGMYDVQKIVKKIRLQSEALERNETTGEAVCWLELDYRLNEDAEWMTIEDTFSESPTQEVDFTKQYGVAGKRLQFRLRGYTMDASKTPVFLAIIIGAVLRTDVKNMYGPFQFLVADDERVGLREMDSSYSAEEKLQLLEDFSDSSNDSMLLMRSTAQMCNDKMVFMNIGTRRQIRFAGAENNKLKGNAYVVSVTMQDA